MCRRLNPVAAVTLSRPQVLVVNPMFFKYVNDHWTERHGRYPSTGMLAIIFALHICDQVGSRSVAASTQHALHHGKYGPFSRCIVPHQLASTSPFSGLSAANLSRCAATPELRFQTRGGGTLIDEDHRLVRS